MNADLLSSLAALLPADQVSASPNDVETHARDESFNQPHPPDAVVWPADTAEVSRVLAWANAHRVPVTAWGGGSSLEGNPIPVRGGLVLDMTRMNRVLEVLPEDFQVRVQPGIIGEALNKHLSRYGLFFPSFPSSAHIATIGGMVSNNAGGMYTIRYGVVGDNVLALEAVLASGEVIRCGSRSIKSVAGYDLLNLLIGSEGTLGIVTEATLRLRGIPRGKLALLVTFDTVEQAVGAVLDALGSEVQLAALELMDERYVGFVNQAKSLGWRETPTLLIEMHGTPESIAAEAPGVQSLCKAAGGEVVVVAATTEEQNRLWEGRRAVRAAVRSLLPGMGVLAGDVGVPISRIPELVDLVRALGKQYDMPTMAYGHAGDGNFHVWAIYKLDDDASLARAVAINEAVVEFAIGAGGTCTAEHGIGLGKRKYLPREHASSLEAMRRVKHLFDPNGILNPGKIFLEP